MANVKKIRGGEQGGKGEKAQVPVKGGGGPKPPRKLPRVMHGISENGSDGDDVLDDTSVLSMEFPFLRDILE